MKRLTIIGLLAFAVGIGLGLFTGQHLLAQQPPIKRTILQQKDLDGVPGREVVMFVAEIAPGGVAGRHLHPGPEFFYVMKVR